MVNALTNYLFTIPKQCHPDHDNHLYSTAHPGREMTSAQNGHSSKKPSKQIIAYFLLLSMITAVGAFFYASRSRREYPGSSRVSFPPTSLIFTILDPRHGGEPGGITSDPRWEYRVFLVELLVFRDGSVKSFAEREKLTPPFNGVGRRYLDEFLRHSFRRVFPEYDFSPVECNLWYPTTGVQYSFGFREDVVENVILLRSEREDNKWHILRLPAENRKKVVAS